MVSVVYLRRRNDGKKNSHVSSGRLSSIRMPREGAALALGTIWRVEKLLTFFHTWISIIYLVVLSRAGLALSQATL
jgi:hypothetical protein